MSTYELVSSAMNFIVQTDIPKKRTEISISPRLFRIPFFFRGDGVGVMMMEEPRSLKLDDAIRQAIK